jgi:hypothetical protein
MVPVYIINICHRSSSILKKATLEAIDRIAPAAKRKRAEFITNAVKDAIFRFEQEKMKEAYRLKPDSAGDVGAWDLPEDWKE